MNMNLQQPNARNIETFDDLDDAIEDAHIDVDALIPPYRDLIRDLVNAGRFDSLSESELRRVLRYLDAIPEDTAAHTAGARATMRRELWSFADENRDNPVLYSLSRGLICMFSHKDDWECAQDSVIFYFLLFLRDAIGDIEPEFVNHFAKALFGKQ